MDVKDVPAGKAGSVSQRIPRSQNMVKWAVMLINTFYTYWLTERVHGALYVSFFHQRQVFLPRGHFCQKRHALLPGAPKHLICLQPGTPVVSMQ